MPQRAELPGESKETPGGDKAQGKTPREHGISPKGRASNKEEGRGGRLRAKGSLRRWLPEEGRVTGCFRGLSIRFPPGGLETERKRVII